MLLGLLLDDSVQGELGVMASIGHDRSPLLTVLAKGISTLGSSALLGPAVALTAAWLVWRRCAQAATALVLVGLGVVVLTNLVKVLVGRPRPPTQHLVSVASASFPSEHAAQSAAILPAIALLIASGRARTVTLVAAGALTLAIGLSRVYLGVHYPTDVLGGWALGGAWLVAVRRSWRLSG